MHLKKRELPDSNQKVKRQNVETLFLTPRNCRCFFFCWERERQRERESHVKSLVHIYQDYFATLHQNTNGYSTTTRYPRYATQTNKQTNKHRHISALFYTEKLNNGFKRMCELGLTSVTRHSLRVFGVHLFLLFC